MFVVVSRNMPYDDSNNYVFTLLTRFMFVVVVVSRNMPDADNEFPFQQ